VRERHYDEGVVEQRSPVRASGAVRVLGLLVLLLGFVAMHVGMVSFDTAMPDGMSGTSHISATSTMSSPLAEHDGTLMTGLYGPGHQLMHACVFILSSVALIVGLVLLVWSLLGTGDPSRPWPWHVRRDRDHPPPWTVLSLAELSILRI
jgi:hypothetical protein